MIIACPFDCAIAAARSPSNATSSRGMRRFPSWLPMCLPTTRLQSKCPHSARVLLSHHILLTFPSLTPVVVSLLRRRYLSIFLALYSCSHINLSYTPLLLSSFSLNGIRLPNRLANRMRCLSLWSFVEISSLVGSFCFESPSLARAILTSTNRRRLVTMRKRR